MRLGPVISGWLPELNLKLAGIHNDEIFFEDDNTLQWVLQQGNPVYLVLELPGFLTSISICFPVPCTTRVYMNSIVACHEDSFVCEDKDNRHIYEAPARVDYRFGMKLLPWMFFRLLDSKDQTKKDHVVNYVVLNSNVRHAGVLIRIFRKNDPSQKQAEWLELYSFRTGNNYQFFEKWQSDPNTKMMARFVPKNVGTPRLIWELKGQDSGHNVKVS